MKNVVLITDVVKELSVEKSILKNQNLILKTPSKLKKEEIFSITGIITGHEINYDKKLLTKFQNCKVIVRYGAGYNNIDIKFAKKSGANSVKFQTYTTEKRVAKNSPIFDILKKCELSKHDFKIIKSYADEIKIDFFSTYV